jgi:hypothetical protein
MNNDKIPLEGHRELKGEDVKRIVGLKNSAFNDYLSARVLYNNDLLLQATFLANTCIEKELKVCFEGISGNSVSIKHETSSIYQRLKYLLGISNIPLNENYLKQIQKIYRSRYYEKLSPGYNFVIIRKKFLAELDFTYDLLNSLTRMKMEDANDSQKSVYESFKMGNDSRLFNNNYILNKMHRTEFVETVDLVYEFRIFENHSNLEFLYASTPGKIKDDGNFNFEALIQQSGSSFKLSHMGNT